MPYVLQERRPDLDTVVNALVKAGLKQGDFELFLLNLSHENWAFRSDTRISNALFEAGEAVVKPNGDINYILFKYCKYHIKPSYNNYKTFMGEIYDAMESISTGEFKNEFREAAEWIRIKLLTPYEEEAIKRNGGI